MKVIYMDNNATTQCSPAVVEAMLPYFSEKYGNASSMHAFGGNNRHAIDAARKSTAELIGAAYPDEIIFTSCATESDNTAIFSAVPDVKVNGDPACRVPNTTNISFGYIEGESILMYLNDFGICASSGSACTSGSLEPSHVLRAMGVPFQFAHGSIRFSLSDQTTEEEVNTVLKELPPIIERLRKISPFSRLAA